MIAYPLVQIIGSTYQGDWGYEVECTEKMVWVELVIAKKSV